MNIDELVIDKIYNLMQQRGWSQSELAKQAKINYQNLNRLLKGGRSITKSDVLPSIAKAFGLDVEDLKKIEGSPVVNAKSEAPNRATLILEIQDKLRGLFFFFILFS